MNQHRNLVRPRVHEVQPDAAIRHLRNRRRHGGRRGAPSGRLANRPAALRRVKLAGRDGAGLDPCAALQTTIELAPHEGREIIFLLGEAGSQEEAGALAARFSHPPTVNEAFERVLSYWDELLGKVEVRTPDAAMDTMLNRWLLYQTLSCRIWARSAFYQSGGAYGFRDQEFFKLKILALHEAKYALLG